MLLTSQLEYCPIDCGALPASANVSRFRGQSGVEEYDLIVRPTQYANIDAQLDSVCRAYRLALDGFGLDARTAVLRRYFCSDLMNQAVSLEANPFSRLQSADEACAVSWVSQPPAPPAKLVLWAHHVSDPRGRLDKSREGATVTLRRGELSHVWSTGLTCTTADTSHDQTWGILEDYGESMRSRGMSLANHVMRTWFFVRGIDANYRGMVTARKEYFAEHGLTPETHFVASTGIEGASTDPAAAVAMDAYAISGLRPEQVRYLAALDHLSPTQVYGVTFERATEIAYRDRKHVLVSGTASIDANGRILHPGNVLRQLDRTLENVEALLDRAGATLKDMTSLIVYVRDPSDHALVSQRMRERVGDAPFEVVVAAVCRPGWLVEVEGRAILPADNPTLATF